jgi:hypothetical protein
MSLFNTLNKIENNLILKKILKNIKYNKINRLIKNKTTLNNLVILFLTFFFNITENEGDGLTVPLENNSNAGNNYWFLFGCVSIIGVIGLMAYKSIRKTSPLDETFQEDNRIIFEELGNKHIKNYSKEQKLKESLNK